MFVYSEAMVDAFLCACNESVSFHKISVHIKFTTTEVVPTRLSFPSSSATDTDGPAGCGASDHMVLDIKS